MQRESEETCVGAAPRLSPQALDILRSLDSLSYGLLDLHSNGRSGGGGGGGGGGGPFASVSTDLIKHGITHLKASVSRLSSSPLSQSLALSQVAHLHLLLGEYTHAYSAYMQYRHLSPSSEADPALFYGLGIIYRCHGQHKQAEECYNKVLSLAPSFPRSGEVHLQLGLLLKRRKAYDEAVAHFDKALNKPDPQLDKFLIQFHSAHVCQLQGQSSQARSKYEVLLGCRTIPPHVKALTQKQLGWLLHKCPEAAKQGEEGVGLRALELLRQAAQSMPECGETWYLLGRVLVRHQRCHEAFSAYQKTVRYPSKISPANTWHSIGHLYFQMQQPRDSLQAYLCCVYLEIHHLQGWRSLGCLYEAVFYPVEALLSYQNAMVSFSKKGITMGKDIDYIRSRITALSQYLALTGGRPLPLNPSMPHLHEAWATLVPDHIRKKQPHPGSPILSLNQPNCSTPSSPFSLPNYPPPPTPMTPVTPVTPGPIMGVTGSRNFRPPATVENGSSCLQKKKVKKKPPAVRRSSGSTPPLPTSASTVHFTHTTSPQNKNGKLTQITAMECNQNGMKPTPSESRTMAAGTDLDLNGINLDNLDNLDFDALAAATSAIPSPTSLSARSRVHVSSVTHPETTSTTTPPLPQSSSPVSSSSSSPPVSSLQSSSALPPSSGLPLPETTTITAQLLPQSTPLLSSSWPSSSVLPPSDGPPLPSSGSGTTATPHLPPSGGLPLPSGTTATPHLPPSGGLTLPEMASTAMPTLLQSGPSISSSSFLPHPPPYSSLSTGNVTTATSLLPHTQAPPYSDAITAAASTPLPSLPLTLSSPPLSTVLPSINSSQRLPHTPNANPFQHHSLEYSQPPSATKPLTNPPFSHAIDSAVSRYQNPTSAMSDSHTPDTASSSSSFNWPSYLMSSLQPVSGRPTTSLRVGDFLSQPMTAPPFPALHTSLAPPVAPPMAPPSTSHVVSVNSAISRPPLPVTAPIRSPSLRGERSLIGERTHPSLPQKRRSSASSSLSRVKSSQSRRSSDTTLTSPPYRGSGGHLSVGNGGGSQVKLEVNPPLPPLPPNMASDPSLLSHIRAVSLSNSLLSPTSSLPDGLNQWSGSGPQSGAGFGPQNATGSGPQSGAGFGLQNATGSGPQSGAGFGPQNATGSGPQSGAGFGPQNATGSGPQSGAGFGLQNATGSGPQSGAGFGVQNATGSGPQSGAGFGLQNATGSGPQSGAGFGLQNATGSGPQSGAGFGLQNATGAGFGPQNATGYGAGHNFNMRSSIIGNSDPQSGIFCLPSGSDQTIPPSAIMTKPQSGTTMVPSGHNQEAPLSTTNPLTGAPHSKKPRTDPEKVQPDIPCRLSTTCNPFQIPLTQVSKTHTTLSPFQSTPSLPTSHHNHHHTDHTHRTRRLSESRKTKSKTIHHFSPRPQPLTLPPTFAGLPLFSPPPPLPHSPLAQQAHHPQRTAQVSTSLPSPSVPGHIPPTTASLQAQQVTQLSPSLQQPLRDVPPEEGPTMTVVTSNEEITSHQAREPPHQGTRDVFASQQARELPHQGTRDVVTSQQARNAIRTSPTSQQAGENVQGNKENFPSHQTRGHAQMPTSTACDGSPLTPQPPVTSVQSLVNQLFAVLQKRGSSSTTEPGAASPSDSSSGISSAGTRLSSLSTTSTAESSPTAHQSVMTPSFPLPSPPPSSLSFPPHIPCSPSPMSPSHTVNTPVSGTTTRPQLSASGSSPQGGSNNNNVQRTTNEVQNDVFHNHQSNTQLHTTHKKRLHRVHSVKNISKFIAPHVPFPSLASAGEYMELEPDLRPPNPPPFQPGMELRPECPFYQVTSYEDAVSTRLHEFCNDPSNPICLIRGVVEAVGLDLDLFSSHCLVDTCAHHEMEVREQMKQAADENCDVLSGKQLWKCESSKSITTVTEYARYQQKMLQKELEGDHSDYLSDSGQGEGRGEREFLSFGTNVDISDEEIWSDQLQELHKLPPFLRVTCPEYNLLSHIGHTVLGMNSVQLYMKVAGSRTPGHQENNNFCSLNINIGPGDCEWFAVPNSYWGMLHSLCEKHKVNFLIGSWWPILDELYRHNVPVYRFTQYKGDVVYINPGTVHWVQANSTCNNIAWNTGPLTAHQFRMAWERYQWNKLQKVHSIVPMIHLTWNLARHVSVSDSHFYSQVRALLESSLAQTKLLLSHLQKAGIPVVWHGRLDGEPAPYCNNCMEEVFNILFVLSHRGEYLVYCHHCASYMRKTFTVLQQYQTEDLEEVVTAFRLHPPEL